MSRNFMIILILSLGTSLSAIASEGEYDPFYITAYEAYGSSTAEYCVKYQPHAISSIAFGTWLREDLRTELEFTFSKLRGEKDYAKLARGLEGISYYDLGGNSTREVKRTRRAWLVNLVKDFYPDGCLTPYFGGGIGLHYDRYTISGNEEPEPKGRQLSPILQGIGGIALPISRSSKFNIEGRLYSDALGNFSQVIGGRLSQRF